MPVWRLAERLWIPTFAGMQPETLAKTQAVTFTAIHGLVQHDGKPCFGIGWERLVGEFPEAETDFIRCGVLMPIPPSPEDLTEAMEILIEQLNAPSREKCAFGEEELTGRVNLVKSLRK